MAETVNRSTGEITDGWTVMHVLSDLAARIDLADQEIGQLSENLKLVRRHREGLIAELRAVARGERQLPFTEAPEGGR